MTSGATHRPIFRPSGNNERRGLHALPSPSRPRSITTTENPSPHWCRASTRRKTLVAISAAVVPPTRMSFTSFHRVTVSAPRARCRRCHKALLTIGPAALAYEEIGGSTSSRSSPDQQERRRPPARQSCLVRHPFTMHRLPRLADRRPSRSTPARTERVEACARPPPVRAPSRARSRRADACTEHRSRALFHGHATRFFPMITFELRFHRLAPRRSRRTTLPAHERVRRRKAQVLWHFVAELFRARHAGVLANAESL